MLQEEKKIRRTQYQFEIKVNTLHCRETNKKSLAKEEL